MVDFKHWENDFASSLISIAIDDDQDLLNRIKYNDDGTIPILFSVGGVELDFNKVVNTIETNLDKLVTEKALTIITDKYDELNKDINIIKSLLDKHKRQI